MKKLAGMLAGLGLAAGLSGCGGGDDGPSPQATLMQSYASALEATDTGAGLTSTALKDSFDAKYLDAGTTQPMVVASLEQDAQAMAAAADYSAFPHLSMSDASVSNCSGDGICTLSGTLTNADADIIGVPFSVQVINTGGVMRLYGDQKNS